MNAMMLCGLGQAFQIKYEKRISSIDDQMLSDKVDKTVISH